jgi:hypothetical protein
VSYRRSQEVHVFSARWLAEHRAALADCGVPSGIGTSQRRWSYAVMHAHDPETGWKVTWLSDQQARELLALLDPHFPSTIGVWLVEELRRHVESVKK